MINSSMPAETPDAPEDSRIDDILKAGPLGALAVAGIATFVVVALWFAFYFFVFVPRGIVQ
jgi:hypothetical protein